MKTILILLFLTLLMQGYAQKDTLILQQDNRPYKALQDSIKNKVLPISPKFQSKNDTSKLYFFPTDTLVFHPFENENSLSKMPVAKFGPNLYNMPVAVPNSTVNYSLKIKKIGSLQEPKRGQGKK